MKGVISRRIAIKYSEVFIPDVMNVLTKVAYKFEVV